MKCKVFLMTVTIIFMVILQFSSVAYAEGQYEEFKKLDMQVLYEFLGKSEGEFSMYTVERNMEELKWYVLKVIKDVEEDDWYADNLIKLVAFGGVKGYPDGTFKGQNSVSVAEFLAMLLSSNGYKQEAGKEVWYSNYIKKANELGIIEDGDNLKFEKGITREQMAKMVCKICNLKNIVYKKESYDLKDTSQLFLFNGYRYDMSIDYVKWNPPYTKRALELGLIQKEEEVKDFKGLPRTEIEKLAMEYCNIQTIDYGDGYFDDEGSFDARWANMMFRNYLIRGYYEEDMNKRYFKPFDVMTRAEAVMIVMDTYLYNTNVDNFKYDKVISVYNQEKNSFLDKYKEKIQAGERQKIGIFITEPLEKNPYITKIMTEYGQKDITFVYPVLTEEEGREEQRELIREMLGQVFLESEVEDLISHMDLKKKKEDAFPRYTIYSNQNLFRVTAVLDPGNLTNSIYLIFEINTKPVLK